MLRDGHSDRLRNVWSSLLCLALASTPAPATPSANGFKDGRPFGEAAENCDASYPLARKNPALLQQLRRRIREAGYGGWLRSGRLSVAVVDLTPRDRIHYAGINDDAMLYSASLPKIVTLLGVAQAAKENKVKWNASVEERLSSMINQSSNTDASWAFDLVGPRYLEDVVRRPGYCFYGNEHGGLWLGRRYGPGGEQNRDPLHNMSHGATARQAARFYTLLAKGLLVSPVGNKRILAAMGAPKVHHKFVKALEDKEGVNILARKSGTWRTFHSDSALVQHGNAKYVIVALSDHRKGSKAMVDIAEIVDDLMVEGAHRAPVVAMNRGRRAARATTAVR